MLIDRTGKPSRFALAAAFTVIALAALGFATYAFACVANAYSVTSSAPPPIGNWTDTAGVWSPGGGFPGCAPGDTAADTNGSPTTLIINSAIPNPIVGLTLNCAGCTIDIQSGGSLTLAGSGSVSGSSSIVVEPGGTLTLQSGTLTFDSGNSLNVNGGNVDVQSGASLVLNGTGNSTNGGTLAVNGGTLSVNNVFTIQSNGAVALDGATVNGSSRIDVNGTLSQNGANSTVSAMVNNNSGGNVHVVGGSLSLSSGSGDSTFTIDSGGTLDFPTGSYSTTANGVISGAGTLQVSGGKLTIGGVTSPNNLTLNAGTLTGTGFLSVAGTWNWNGGTLTGSGGRELAGTGTANVTGSVSAPTLDGTALNLYGTTSLTAAANPLTLVNAATLTNYGNFAINTDGSMAGDFTNTVDNAPNGVVSKSSGAGTFTVAPTFNNSSTVNSFSGTLVFAGNGTDPGGFYYAASGCTLAFAAGGRSVASFVSADGTVSFPSGTTTFTGTYNVAGTTSISGGAMAVNSASATSTHVLTFTAGTLNTASDFSLNGTGTWSGGTMTGSASFHVAPGATMTIDCANNLAVISNTTYTVDSGGTTVYTAASPNYLKMIGGVLTNNGTFDIQTDQPIVGAIFSVSSAPSRPSKRALLIGSSPSITNNGTWQKSAGSGTTTIDPDFTNTATVLAQSGTMSFSNTYVQSGGTTTLGAGGITVATPLQLNGGTLNGSGTITGDVQNNAIVAPGDATTTIGDIDITGNYTQGPAASLNLKIAGVGNYDELNVTGSDTLDGALNVSLINGFVPSNGDMFPILSFASRTGDFAVKNFPPFDGTHGSWVASYTPTALDLTAVVSPSQSDLSVATNGPGSVNAGAPLSYTVDVTNNGPDAAAGTITVVDQWPSGSTLATDGGTNWNCSLHTSSSSTCFYTLGVASGQSLPTLTINLNAPAAGGTATNTATVSFASDPNSTNNVATASTTVVPEADLQIAKTGPAGVIAGQTVTYTITVSNVGPSGAANVIVSDPTPANLTFVSSSCGPFPCNIGPLTSGTSSTITATYSTSPSFAGNVTNTASVSSTTNDPDNTNNSASATTNVGAQAELAITKSGPASVLPGQLVTYTIAVTNSGPSSATSVVVTDATPPGLTFVSNSGACTSAFPCALGTLAAGAPATTITSTYSVPANYPAPAITNTASVSSSVNDPNTSDNSASATTLVTTQTDLSIAKSGPASASIGTNVTYTIVVTNNGTLTANNVFVSDPTPAGLTFVSNSGACTTSFPCGLGTIGAGQSATITSTYSVPQTYAGTTISNTATVSSSTPDGNSSNNSATAITPVSTARVADLAITKSGPETGQASIGTNVTFHIVVTNAGPNGATNVVISDPTPNGLTWVSNSGACTTPFPCVIPTLGVSQLVSVDATYTVNSSARGSVVNTASVTSSATDPNTSNNSSSVGLRTSPLPACPTAAPQLLTPAAGATQLSPVTFSWTSVAHATSYVLSIVSASGTSSITTASTSATIDLAGGSYSWFVAAQGPSNCPPTGSATSSFSVCTTPAAPLASVVGEATTGQSYAVQWPVVDGAVSYELQEAGNAAFTNPTTFTITGGTSQSFTKVSDVATPFFYRVRAVSACGGTGPYSDTVRVVVIPLPSQNTPGGPSFNAPLGSTQAITFPLFVKGVPGGTTSFIATADKPWISILPTSGLLPPEGITLLITIDPTGLTNGTWTGTVIIITGSTTITGRFAPNGSSTSSTPVSVSIVTPVSPGKLNTPSANAQIIPSAGHLSGASEWRSDVRIANPGTSSMPLSVTFNDGSSIKQTTINVDAGTTVALDDVARNWFGIGSLGDSANGTLTIDPGAGRRVIGASDVTKTAATVVTSRTYNASASGTLGQFIPAVPFANFLSAAGGSSLILQQIAQSSAFHTNLGLVEASGKPATVVVSTFDASGNSLFSVPVSLNGGEQKQMNSFLAQNNVSLTSGHIEVKPASGDGKVTAYASIVDNKSNDPFLVSGVPLSATGTTRFIVPGIADLSGGNATWRSDVRIFNGSNAPATVTLTFYPNANPSAAVSKDVTINPSEVKPLDGVLQSTFGVTNAGGTLHVTTAVPTPLVVSARTYDQTANGTLGQFIAATTLSDAVGNGDRSLQLVQLEDSPRYRTNLGIAEVNGQPATVEISVFLPGSKAAPKATIALGAYDSRQIPILSSLGLGNAYNARVAVRVIDGAGKVTAYGSVIDQSTQAPVYVPAQ